MADSLIFDMDGTLFQTNKILETALENTFSYLKSLGEWEGVTPLDQYREIMGVPLPKVWETLLPNHSKKIREQTDDYFLEMLIQNINKGVGALYPNVEELFCFLKENSISIYIASNGLPQYLNAIVDFYNLDNWVTETFSISQIQSLNKADLVKIIIKKYGIKKAAVVGDRLSDFKAAQANELISIGCRFDFAQEAELSQADYIIDNLLEIKAILPIF